MILFSCCVSPRSNRTLTTLKSVIGQNFNINLSTLETKSSLSVKSNSPSPSEEVAVSSDSRIALSSLICFFFSGSDRSGFLFNQLKNDGQAPAFSLHDFVSKLTKSSHRKCSEQTLVYAETLKSFLRISFNS